MRVVLLLQRLLAILAVAAYAANGAQPHLVVSEGETIALPVCSVGHVTTKTITIGGGGLEETSETCCGDCTTPALAPSGLKSALRAPLVRTVRLTAKAVDQISPRSPLWPGAPPQGPPLS
ncbi:MAG: hypothetical protein AAGH90_09140 [Pseudomonadota bacterium]